MLADGEIRAHARFAVLECRIGLNDRQGDKDRDMVLKKRLTAVACALALMLALPTLAWADPSPEFKPIEPGYSANWQSNEITLVDFDGYVDVVYGSLNEFDSDQVIVNWLFGGEASNVDLEFTIDQKYAGQTVTIIEQGYKKTRTSHLRTVNSNGTFTLNDRQIFSSDYEGTSFSVVLGNHTVSDYQPGFKHEAVGQGGQPVSATLEGFEGTVTSVSVSKQADAYASNVPAGATVLYTWEIEGDATNLDLAFQVERGYAGQKVTVFVEHGDGAVEQRVATVGEDGSFKIHVDRLSRFSIALGDYGDAAAGDYAASKLDPNAKSPKTGADLGGAASATALMALAAGAAFVALRRQAAK